MEVQKYASHGIAIRSVHRAGLGSIKEHTANWSCQNRECNEVSVKIKKRRKYYTYVFCIYDIYIYICINKCIFMYV